MSSSSTERGATTYGLFRSRKTSGGKQDDSGVETGTHKTNGAVSPPDAADMQIRMRRPVDLMASSQNSSRTSADAKDTLSSVAFWSIHAWQTMMVT